MVKCVLTALEQSISNCLRVVIWISEERTEVNKQAKF